MVKLDLSEAWDGATRRLAANRELVLILGGIFFFLPLLAMFMALLGSDFQSLAGGGEPDPEKMTEEITAFFRSYWWAFLLIGVSQWAGTIALLRVLEHRQRPTVNDAMKSIPRLMLPMIGVQILATLATQALPSLASLIGGGVGGLISVIALPVSIYLWVKFTLTSAIVALEEETNPFTALRRSWELTRKNSFRLFGFFVLLLFAGLVLLIIAAIVFGLILSLLGERGELIGTAVFYALVASAAYVLSFALVASIYRQLSGSHDGPPVPKAG